MQIHELNSFSGTPSSSDYLAIDDGSETSKVPANGVGITTALTQAEAIAGTGTSKRVVTPSVFKSAVQAIGKALFFEGADGTSKQELSISMGSTFVAQNSGWLVVTLNTGSGVSQAPYADIRAYSDTTTVAGILASSWGITTAGATMTVSAPIKKGCRYMVYGARCTLASARVFVNA